MFQIKREPNQEAQEEDPETGDLIANPYLMVCLPGSRKPGIAINSTTLQDKCDGPGITREDLDEDFFAESQIQGDGGKLYTLFSVTGKYSARPVVTSEIRYAHFMGFISESHIASQLPKVHLYFNPPEPKKSSREEEPVPEDDVPF